MPNTSRIDDPERSMVAASSPISLSLSLCGSNAIPPTLVTKRDTHQHKTQVHTSNEKLPQQPKGADPFAAIDFDGVLVVASYPLRIGDFRT